MARIFALLLLAALSLPGWLHAAELPSRNPRVVIPLLERFTQYGHLQDIEQVLGRPDDSFISGFRIYIFHLDDTTSLYVSSPDSRRVFSVRRSAPGADAHTLYEPLGEDLMKPLPVSAPF